MGWQAALGAGADALGFLGNLGFGIWDRINQKKTVDKNFALQQAQFNWQKDMTNKAWDREDNAVQRRVADLKAAGLHPALAAGSSAGSSHAPVIQAPQKQQVPKWQQQQISLGNMLSMAQYGKTQAEVENIKAQTRRTNKMTSWMDPMNQQKMALTDAQINQVAAQTGLTHSQISKTEAEINNVYARTDLTETDKILREAQIVMENTNIPRAQQQALMAATERAIKDHDASLIEELGVRSNVDYGMFPKMAEYLALNVRDLLDKGTTGARRFWQWATNVPPEESGL